MLRPCTLTVTLPGQTAHGAFFEGGVYQILPDFDPAVSRLITDTTRQSSKLFDRSKDPREQHDVAGQHPDVVKELQSLIASRIAESRQLVAAPGRPADIEDLREELRALGYLDDAGQPEDLGP